MHADHVYRHSEIEYPCTLRSTPIRNKEAGSRRDSSVRSAAIDRFLRHHAGAQGFDVYSEDLMPGGMVFLRFNADHHGVALVGGLQESARGRDLHHFAFEVATLDEVFHVRNHLRAHGVPIVFEGRRRAGVQIAVEFTDPDGHNLEIYWGMDRIDVDQRVRPPSEWRGATTLEEAVANPVRGQAPVVTDPSLTRRTS